MPITGDRLDLGDLSIPRPSIAASLVGDAVSTYRQAEALGADLLEVRLDLIEGDPLEALSEIRRGSRLPIIATNRMAREGGSFRGSESECSEIVMKASELADIVDVELQAGFRADLMRRIERPVIMSYHDFSGMPSSGEIGRMIGMMQEAGAAISKVAVMPSAPEHCIELLRILVEEKGPLCLIGMGEVGRHLRAVAPIYGSALTYGYVSKAAAPGQMSVAELVQAKRLIWAGPGDREEVGRDAACY